AGRAYFQLVLAPLVWRDFEVAGDVLEPGLEYCTERGLETWRRYLLASRAALELHRGRWEDAADDAALVLDDPGAAPVARGWALATLGLLRARRGDPDAAGPLDEAHELVRSSGEAFRIAPVAAARAEAAWLGGDAEAVVRATEDALSLTIERDALWEAAELACWRSRAGLRDELPSLPPRSPFRLAWAGDGDGAATRWLGLGCPYDAALALAEASDDEALRRALDELKRLGAPPAAAIVAGRLRERGARGVPRGPRAATQQ